MEYYKRVTDKILEQKLKLYGAVLIEGCKWCGKSTTARQYAKSSVEFQNQDDFNNNYEAISLKPSVVLSGEKPKLIDEWQDIPMVWDAIRYDVDKTGLKGQYILTGSASPREKKPKHSGIGRIAKVLMRPMSLYESLESSGEVSLTDLFQEKKLKISFISKLSIEDIAFLICRGGWPGVLDFKGNDAFTLSRDYVDDVIDSELNLSDGVERNPIRIRNLLRSLARNISTTVSLSAIKMDMQTDSVDLSEKTIESYLGALEKIYLIDDIRAWTPKIRSKTTLRTSKKREFVDPSIATAVLRITDKDLLNDFNTFGFFFEALVLRDLKIYADYLDGDVFYYRDKTNLECDAIIHLHDGRWAAIEIKLGSQRGIDEAVMNFNKLKSTIDMKVMKEPSFYMIITSSGYAYQREDGIYVVPIGCLKY